MAIVQHNSQDFVILTVECKKEKKLENHHLFDAEDLGFAEGPVVVRVPFLGHLIRRYTKLDTLRVKHQLPFTTSHEEMA